MYLYMLILTCLIYSPLSRESIFKIFLFTFGENIFNAIEKIHGCEISYNTNMGGKNVLDVGIHFRTFVSIRSIYYNIYIYIVYLKKKKKLIHEMYVAIYSLYIYLYKLIIILMLLTYSYGRKYRVLSVHDRT